MASFNKLGDELVRKARGFFDNDVQSPSQKRGVGDGVKKKNPFPQVQSEFLSNMFADTMSTLSSHLDNVHSSLDKENKQNSENIKKHDDDLIDVRSRLQVLQDENKKLHNKVLALESKQGVGADPETAKRLIKSQLEESDTADVVRQIVKEEAALINQANSSSSSMPGPQLARKTPYEQRTLAKLCHVGEKLSAEECEQTAKTVLIGLGFSSNDWHAIAGVRRENCRDVEILFCEPETLRTAKYKVKALHKTMPGCSKPLWLEAKKESVETRPTKVMHEIFDLLMDFEAGKPQRWCLEKSPQKNTVVQVDGDVQKRLGYVIEKNGVWQWHWTTHGRDRYTQEEKELCSAVAMMA